MSPSNFYILVQFLLCPTLTPVSPGPTVEEEVLHHFREDHMDDLNSYTPKGQGQLSKALIYPNWDTSKGAGIYRCV